MSKIYYVDVPNHAHCVGDDHSSWINVVIVKTLKAAQTVMLERFGINPEDSGIFITEGDDGV